MPSKDNYILTGLTSGLKSRSDGNPKEVTGVMQETGLTGEHIVASAIVRRFMKEFPDRESRKKGLEIINNFLKANGFDSLRIVNDEYDERCVLNSLWYTKEGSKPFDIITLSEGKIRLIEVKSTRGNNLLHFSKRESILANKYRENYEVMVCDISKDRIYRIGNPLPEKPEYSNSYIKIRPRGYDVELLKLSK